MNKKLLNIQQLLAFILLVFYSYSFYPSFIFHHHDHHDHHDHHHNHTHNENELNCGDTNLTDNHTICSHEQHLKSLPDHCLLCEFNAICDHEFLTYIIDSDYISFIQKDYELCQRWYSQAVIYYSNKSPPELI